MDKSNILVAVIILVIIGYLGYPSLTSAKNVQEGIGTADGNAEVVLIGVSGSEYVPNPILVKAGVPTILRNDGSIGGCAMSVIQRELGINANFAKSKDYMFTPTKKGTYTITCSMGMYKGTL